MRILLRVLVGGLGMVCIIMSASLAPYNSGAMTGIGIFVGVLFLLGALWIDPLSQKEKVEQYNKLYALLNDCKTTGDLILDHAQKVRDNPDDSALDEQLFVLVKAFNHLATLYNEKLYNTGFESERNLPKLSTGEVYCTFPIVDTVTVEELKRESMPI